MRTAWEIAHAVPAVTAATAVLLFLLAALLPLSVLAVLVAAHLTLTLALVMPRTRSAADRAALFCDHVSELAFLLVALAVSVTLDPAGLWQTAVPARLMALVTLASLVGVIVPKMQVLRMTLLQARSPVSLRAALALIATAIAAVVVSPMLLGGTLAGVLAAASQALLSWKL